MPTAMIENVVTSQGTNQVTDLQIALGLLTRNSKKVVDQLYNFRVTCSYDEVVRFKKSAAHADTSAQGISGLIQIIADNFDTDISFLNRKVSTYALAMIAIQPSEAKPSEKTSEEQIRRIKKEEMSQKLPENDDLLNVTYQCTKS